MNRNLVTALLFFLQITSNDPFGLYLVKHYEYDQCFFVVHVDRCQSHFLPKSFNKCWITSNMLDFILFSWFLLLSILKLSACIIVSLDIEETAVFFFRRNPPTTSKDKQKQPRKNNTFSQLFHLPFLLKIFIERILLFGFTNQTSNFRLVIGALIQCYDSPCLAFCSTVEK